MIDKELLELAAKAAGIQDGNWLGDGSYWVGAYDGGCEWNPLTDDGDALRLAVKLKLNIDFYSDNEGVYVSDTKYIMEAEFFDSETDHHAATRRTIVRAAAEIGKERE